MAVSYPADLEEDDILSEINTTPLVDVMLVLLIIFLITVPVVSASVGVFLPRETSQLHQARPSHVVISITERNETYWYDLALPDRATLQTRLQTLATQSPQPEIHIRADARADYAAVAKVVLAAQQAGMVRIGFMTEPHPGARHGH
jgi:biopolymer transport protein ExbD